MSDTRVKVETTKPLDLWTLDQQLGGYGLVSDDRCVIAVEGSPVTFQQLKTAIEQFDSNAVANAEAQQLRQQAFQTEADPLYFGWQRGENTEQQWLDKCAEIRARHPYV